MDAWRELPPWCRCLPIFVLCKKELTTEELCVVAEFFLPRHRSAHPVVAIMGELRFVRCQYHPLVYCSWTTRGPIWPSGRIPTGPGGRFNLRIFDEIDAYIRRAREFTGEQPPYPYD